MLNILDRYIIKQFLLTLLFSLFALCIIFLIVNLLENLDEFIDQKATFLVIAKYYIHFFPEILKIVTPIAVLLSTLFSIGRLSVSNEITAMKAGSLSLYRLMVPLGILCMLISFGQLYFNGWIVPKATEKRNEIEAKYLNRSKGDGPLYNLFLRDTPRRNLVMRYYNSSMKSGHQVSIEEFSDELKPRLLMREEAEMIKWDTVNKKWALISGIKRDYSDKYVTTMRFDTLYPNIRITHNQVLEFKRTIEEMNFDELKSYIEILKLGGKDVRKSMIEYYGQYAYPFSNFIVILFGVPFASIRKKGGIAVQIGAAIVVSFMYLLFMKVGEMIGYSTNIDPILSGWLANIVFFVAGLFNLFTTKT